MIALIAMGAFAFTYWHVSGYQKRLLISENQHYIDVALDYRDQPEIVEIYLESYARSYNQCAATPGHSISHFDYFGNEEAYLAEMFGFNSGCAASCRNKLHGSLNQHITWRDHILFWRQTNRPNFIRQLTPSELREAVQDQLQ